MRSTCGAQQPPRCTRRQVKQQAAQPQLYTHPAMPRHPGATRHASTSPRCLQSWCSLAYADGAPTAASAHGSTTQPPCSRRACTCQSQGSARCSRAFRLRWSTALRGRGGEETRRGRRGEGAPSLSPAQGRAALEIVRRTFGGCRQWSRGFHTGMCGERQRRRQRKLRRRGRKRRRRGRKRRRRGRKRRRRGRKRRRRGRPQRM